MDAKEYVRKEQRSLIYMGIDPGQKGGIALISESTQESHIYSNDALKAICESLKGKDVMCVVEKVGAMPGQGVSSTFSFGQSFGYILGVLEANGIPYQLVSPRKWKNHFSLDNDKQKSIDTAKRLFPNVSLLPTDRCRKDSDGMAESLLMALYAKRISSKQED